MDLRKIITWRILKGNFRYCFRSFLFVLLCVLWLILPSNPLKILLVFSEEKATWMNLLKHLDSEFEVNRTKNSKRNAWNYLLKNETKYCLKNNIHTLRQSFAWFSVLTSLSNNLDVMYRPNVAFVKICRFAELRYNQNFVLSQIHIRRILLKIFRNVMHEYH